MEPEPEPKIHSSARYRPEPDHLSATPRGSSRTLPERCEPEPEPEPESPARALSYRQQQSHAVHVDSTLPLSPISSASSAAPGVGARAHIDPSADGWGGGGGGASLAGAVQGLCSVLGVGLEFDAPPQTAMGALEEECWRLRDTAALHEMRSGERHAATPALIGPPVGHLDFTRVVVSDPPYADDPSGSLLNAAKVRGRIVLVHRGKVPYASKVRAAQRCGAEGVIIVNMHDEPFLIDMLLDVDGRPIDDAADLEIPVVGVPLSVGEELQAHAERRQLRLSMHFDRRSQLQSSITAKLPAGGMIEKWERGRRETIWMAAASRPGLDEARDEAALRIQRVWRTHDERRRARREVFRLRDQRDARLHARRRKSELQRRANRHGVGSSRNSRSSSWSRAGPEPEPERALEPEPEPEPLPAPGTRRRTPRG